MAEFRKLVEGLVSRVERARPLDSPAATVAAAVDRAAPPHSRARDALHGTWLGHQLHPMLVTVPIGMWTSVHVLDLLAGKPGRRSAQVLTAGGALVALPTAAAGLADWASLGQDRRAKRLGLVHGTLNLITASLYTASYLQRRRGRHARGAAIGLVGAGTLSVSGYLGGHLSYARGAGVNRNADQPPGPKDWTRAAALADLQDGTPVRIEIGGSPVLLLRTGGDVLALGARCGHLGGPLEKGELHDGCVTCPWHGSVFRLADGEVVHGPATVGQPVYAVRVQDGVVELRAPE